LTLKEIARQNATQNDTERPLHAISSVSPTGTVKVRNTKNHKLSAPKSSGLGALYFAPA
jgi:hypothetical protein